MATYRIGIGSFNLKDGAVGIGTEATGLGNLKVEGTYKTTDLDVTGVSTFTRYAGFAGHELNISKDTSLTGEHQTTGDIVVGVNSTFTVSVGATVDVGTVPSVSIGTHFSPPIGGVEDRPEVPVEGTVRYNRDLNTLEFYNGVEWRQFTVSGQSGRAVFAGGGSPLEYPVNVGYLSGKIIDYVQIATTGNAVSFGDLTQHSRHMAGFSNHIRGVIYHGSATPGDNNVIDKITIASQGNATSFGLIDGTDTYAKRGAASSTRGVFVGGSPGNTDIDYVEIMTDGNSADFGDLSTARRASQVCCDGKRVVVAGGRTTAPNPLAISSIESFMIASKGNVSSDFGQMVSKRCDGFGFSNSVRGIFGAGKDGPNRISEGWVESLTIASGGNAVYFGDCFTGSYVKGCASQTRGLLGGGSMPGPAIVNVVEYVTIESAGSSTDFGDLTRPCYDPAAISDCHGGLGGY